MSIEAKAPLAIKVYSRSDCHLCEIAINRMQSIARTEGVPISIHEVDIDEDEGLRERYTNDVPVIVIGDREVFRHRVLAESFRALLRSQFMDEGGDSVSELAEKNCVPCRGGVPPLGGEAIDELLAKLRGDWTVVESHHLEKAFKFGDFRTALDFTNRVGELAEEQGHHPDIYLAWGKVKITVWTHKVDGLTDSDFVLAAKIDRDSY